MSTTPLAFSEARISALLVAAWRRQTPASIVVLAMASAIGLALIDVVYVVRHVIRPINLGDALLEVPFLTIWTARLTRKR